MSEKIKYYSNGEITVIWKPDLCHHAAECVNGLPEVFNPKERPWINPKGCNTDALKKTINKCPSGALTYLENSEMDNKNRNNEDMSEETKEIETTRAQVIPNGPILIHCNLSVEKPDGTVEIRENKASFCRCGLSNNKPFCDGSHKGTNWESK